jgi:hypothetical protein
VNWLHACRLGSPSGDRFNAGGSAERGEATGEVVGGYPGEELVGDDQPGHEGEERPQRRCGILSGGVYFLAKTNSFRANPD